MRMHSVDYAVTRCLSVCLSVTRRYRVETAKHVIHQTFHRRVATSFLIFTVPNLMGCRMQV